MSSHMIPLNSVNTWVKDEKGASSIKILKYSSLKKTPTKISFSVATVYMPDLLECELIVIYLILSFKSFSFTDLSSKKITSIGQNEYVECFVFFTYVISP